MKKYKANYTWVYSEDELSSEESQCDEGLIEVEAEDYNQARKIAVEQIEADEQQYGGYLIGLELTEVKNPVFVFKAKKEKEERKKEVN